MAFYLMLGDFLWQSFAKKRKNNKLVAMVALFLL